MKLIRTFRVVSWETQPIVTSTTEHPATLCKPEELYRWKEIWTKDKTNLRHRLWLLIGRAMIQEQTQPQSHFYNKHLSFPKGDQNKCFQGGRPYGCLWGWNGRSLACASRPLCTALVYQIRGMIALLYDIGHPLVWSSGRQDWLAVELHASVRDRSPSAEIQSAYRMAQHFTNWAASRAPGISTRYHIHH